MSRILPYRREAPNPSLSNPRDMRNIMRKARARARLETIRMWGFTRGNERARASLLSGSLRFPCSLAYSNWRETGLNEENCLTLSVNHALSPFLTRFMEIPSHEKSGDGDEISTTIIHESAAGRKSGYAPGRKAEGKARKG